MPTLSYTHSTTLHLCQLTIWLLRDSQHQDESSIGTKDIHSINGQSISHGQHQMKWDSKQITYSLWAGNTSGMVSIRRVKNLGRAHTTYAQAMHQIRSSSGELSIQTKHVRPLG